MWWTACAFSLETSFAVFQPKRVMLLFHCIAVYNSHQHPYIGSTSVLLMYFLLAIMSCYKEFNISADCLDDCPILTMTNMSLCLFLTLLTCRSGMQSLRSKTAQHQNPQLQNLSGLECFCGSRVSLSTGSYEDCTHSRDWCNAMAFQMRHETSHQLHVYIQEYSIWRYLFSF